MKSYCLAVVLVVLLATLPSRAAQNPGARPKVGLVLSGGGAKGFAHIGTLKLIDSLRIPVDYIAGTSMGGIIGGLYAIGYSGIELEKLAERSDWQEIFADEPARPDLPFLQKEQSGRYQLEFGLQFVKPVPPSGLIFGQKVSLLLANLTFPYERVADFDHLPIPFRCVAVDLISGREVVLRKGSLSRALRATMSIPTVFSPVEWGDSLLVDGGLTNNLPVDVVKKMGADVVIAVDVQSPLLPRDKLKSALTVLEQTLTLVGTDRWRENLKLADLVISPPIGAYTSADFENSKISRILAIGDQAARENRTMVQKLQEQHGLQQVSHDSLSKRKRWIVQNVQITGYTAMPFASILDRVGFKPNDVLKRTQLQTAIAEMRATGRFESFDYELIPVQGDTVSLFLRVQETRQPVVRSIYITGNKKLPFVFIYRLLGLTPGIRLDTQALNQRIMDIYGMGYFELLQYDVTPVDDERIDITFQVKELPFRKLRVGLRYDDRHKLVAAVSIQATNLVIPGIRFEDELQFAGLTQFTFKASYPSRALNMPIYPFARLHFRDIPTYIYEGLGNRIAEYQDRGLTLAGGLGLVMAKSLNATMEYQHERLNIYPNVALPDPVMFPTWKDRLRKVVGRLNVDRLDDVLLPRTGMWLRADYEASLRQLHSPLYYQQLRLACDLYSTWYKRHTMRLYGFYGRSRGDVPIYKYINQGRPATFVGMQYDQLYASDVSIVRVDYRYEHKKDIYIKLIANAAFDVKYNMLASPRLPDMTGYGAGVVFLSPIGPIEIIAGRGSRNYLGDGRKQTLVYFTLGNRF